MSSNLIRDVVGAAYSIDYTVEKLEQAAAAAQSWSDKYFTPTRKTPHEGLVHSASIEVTEAYVEFANLVMWAKALQERLDRPNDSGDRRRLGLLPALSPKQPVYRAVEPLVRQVWVALDKVRGYANYSTHVSLLPYLGAGAEVHEDGRLEFWIPDTLPTNRRVYSFYELTLAKKLDAVLVSREIASAVDVFMNRLLTAFETLEWSQCGE